MSASPQAQALRVNFVGELGWELHHPIEMQNTIFDLLMDAGTRVRHQALRHPRDGLRCGWRSPTA